MKDQITSQRLVHIWIALCVVGCLPARGEPTTAQVPRTKADVYSAIKEVENLSRGMRDGLETYHKDLKKAMEIYGVDFYDPGYKQKLAAFDRDIRIGNTEESRKMKTAIFAAMMWTAGIRLDPDPFRCWADIEERLASYQAKIDKAREMIAYTNVFAAAGRDNIPPNELLKLRTQWQVAAQEVERARDRSLGSRPTRLQQGETLVTKATEGYNLHFNFFGVEVGRELGNATALAQLRYLGRIDAGHVFLLTMLVARYGKTRVDTIVEPRAILMHSDARDPLRYGYAVTIHDYSGYRMAGARVADVVPVVRDWIWKVSPEPDSAIRPSIAELEEVVGRVRESRRAIDQAMDAFKQLSISAARQNDAILEAAAKAADRKARIPEQDLKAFFPAVRAKLYAGRALFAGDPRFLAARDAVVLARRQASDGVRHGRELFSHFNCLPVHAAPELPWKRIDKLAFDLMIAAEEAERSGARADAFLPPIGMGDERPIIVRTNSAPGVIVAQVSRGYEGKDEQAVLIVEHIVRDVHWAVKGIERREYTSELIRVSATGIHQVQGAVLGPEYIQGPGGIGQVFRRVMQELPVIQE